jgi:hypothetical protein
LAVLVVRPDLVFKPEAYQTLAISDVAFFALLPTMVKKRRRRGGVSLFMFFFCPFGSNATQIGYSSEEVPISCRTRLAGST